ncbi:MAG: porin [Duganella sp.]
MTRTFLPPCTALALAVFCTTATADSQVALYGAVDAALAYTSNQQGQANRYLRSGNKDGSRFGVRGVEDLGQGTELLFTLEAGFNLDDGTSAQAGSLFNRQAYVGLSNKRLGTLTAGRQYAPYFTFLSPLGPLGAVTGAAGAAAGDIDGLSIIIRNSNAVGYVSPDWSGVRLGLMAAGGEQAGHAGSGGALSAALKYDGAAWRYALGYQLLKNGRQQATWDPAAASNFARSPVNAGYLSAGDVRYLTAGVRRQFGPVSVGGTLSNVQYRPNAASRFADHAVFNTAGLVATWQTATPWVLGMAANLTRASAANGIANPANYRQVALQQAYWLSPRTAVYVLQAFQRARGATLGADGVTVVDAVAVVGDSQAGSPSSNGRQNVIMLGLRHAF